LQKFQSFHWILIHLDRPIIRETKSLRVSNADFEIKTQIGNGYFGEVDVSLIKFITLYSYQKFLNFILSLSLKNLPTIFMR
jgi:hypothetical protein